MVLNEEVGFRKADFEEDARAGRAGERKVDLYLDGALLRWSRGENGEVSWRPRYRESSVKPVVVVARGAWKLEDSAVWGGRDDIRLPLVAESRLESELDESPLQSTVSETFSGLKERGHKLLGGEVAFVEILPVEVLPTEGTG